MALTLKAQKAMALMDEISMERRKREGRNWLPTIKPGTPEWAAWKNWRKENELSTGYMDRIERMVDASFTVCQEFPPVGAE